MLFKSARRDSAITEDPTEFVGTVRKERRIKTKRPFTLPELHSVLELANDEWRSMILFGLYTGQRLGDIAERRSAENVSLDTRGEIAPPLRRRR
jgi:integrase